MKYIKSFAEFVNEGKLNEEETSTFKEYIDGYANDLVEYSGVTPANAKKFSAEIIKVVETHFKTKINDIVVEFDTGYEGDYKNLKTVADIPGKKFGMDSETLDYLGIESDEKGNHWFTAYDVQRGDMLLVRKK